MNEILNIAIDEVGALRRRVDELKRDLDHCRETNVLNVQGAVALQGRVAQAERENYAMRQALRAIKAHLASGENPDEMAAHKAACDALDAVGSPKGQDRLAEAQADADQLAGALTLCLGEAGPDERLTLLPRQIRQCRRALDAHRARS